MSLFKQGCQKWDHSYNNDKKWVSHILFLRNRGLIVYLAALKKGAILAAHPYYALVYFAEIMNCSCFPD